MSVNSTAGRALFTYWECDFYRPSNRTVNQDPIFSHHEEPDNPEPFMMMVKIPNRNSSSWREDYTGSTGITSKRPSTAGSSGHDQASNVSVNAKVDEWQISQAPFSSSSISPPHTASRPHSHQNDQALTTITPYNKSPSSAIPLRPSKLKQVSNCASVEYHAK